MMAESARVLYVEDNEATRYATTRVLTGAGFQVTVAASGDLGVTLARTQRPDLVLLDVKLPGVDGFEVCRTLKADPATSAIPIVFLSASHASPRDQVTGLEGGADMYLTHPAEPHVLVAALNALLRVRRAEARYRRLSEANVVGVMEYELGGRVLECNAECLRVFAAQREDLAAGRLHWDQLVPDDLRPQAEQMFEQLRTTGAAPGVEVELHRLDAQRVPVLIASAAIGGGSRGFSVVVDLTDRKRVAREREEALARAEAAQRRLAFLLSVSGALLGEPDSIANGLRRVAGLCAGAIADWCAVDRLGPDGPERLAVAAADPARHSAAFALASRTPSPGEGAIARALTDGGTQHLEDVGDVAALEAPQDASHRAALEALGVRLAVVHPLLAHGRVLGALTLVRSVPGAEMSTYDAALGEEVAARASAALENARLHEELARSVRAREDALAEVSHDLRNPLSSVLLGAVQLERSIGREDLPDLVLRRAGSIRRSGERMNRLVHDLLDLARFEAGRLSLDIGAVDPTALVAEAIDAAKDAAREQGVRIESRVEPALSMRGDAERLGRVLSNLLSNAIRASAHGGRVEVLASRRPEGVAISVRDEGRGIPPELRAHLFERYWRGRESAGGGVGLGLSIVKALVEGHGGRIWVESEPGQGATFTFVVPA